jgi:hypothetical protein
MRLIYPWKSHPTSTKVHLTPRSVLSHILNASLFKFPLDVVRDISMYVLMLGRLPRFCSLAAVKEKLTLYLAASIAV